MVGGLGNDTYIANNGDVITEGAGAGSGTDLVLTTSASFTLATNVENLTFIGVGGFTGNGNGSANEITGGNIAAAIDVLSGGGGADILVGLAGVDSLNGDGGNDILNGGAGNDVMNGGAGFDTFVFASGFGNDIISGFDAVGTGTLANQDLLDISGLGVTAGTFVASVIITDLGDHTLVTIGADTITLIGVNGAATNIITQQDFILA